MTKPNPHSTLTRQLWLEACTPILMREARRIRKQHDRAKKQGREATLTFSQWLRLLAHFDWRCAYCRKHHYECVEHIVPLHAGGGTTADNVMPSCHQCNSKYNDMYYHQDRLKAQVKALAQLS